MDTIKSIFKPTDLSWFSQNKETFIMVAALIGAYSAFGKPKLPDRFEKITRNSFFKLTIVSYLVYHARQDPLLALLIAIGFLLTNITNREDFGCFPTPAGTLCKP
jgi:hypothetical protein